MSIAPGFGNMSELQSQVNQFEAENARLGEELATLSLYKNLAEQYGLSVFEDFAAAQKDAERYRKFIAISNLTRDDDPALHAECDKLPENPSKEDFDKLLDALPAMKENKHD